MKPKFEVGDIIRSKKGGEARAVITAVSELRYYFRYTHDITIGRRNMTVSLVEEQCELAVIADTAITRKLYPNAKITKKGLMV